MYQREKLLKYMLDEYVIEYVRMSKKIIIVQNQIHHDEEEKFHR